MSFFTTDENCLDSMWDPRRNLFGSELWYDYFKEESGDQKRARIAKLAAEIPTPPEDKEPF